MIEGIIEGAATPLAIGAIFAALYAGTYWRQWIRGPRPEPARRDGRISAREMELLGDDWRDCIRRTGR